MAAPISLLLVSDGMAVYARFGAAWIGIDNLSFNCHNYLSLKKQKGVHMAIGLDGFIEERVEKLFVSEDYKLFFLTGQKNDQSWRRAYITVKPFHALDAEAIEQMKAVATRADDKDAGVQISLGQGNLAFYDKFTGTTSRVPWTELDTEIQERLRGNVTDAFAKYGAKKSFAAKDEPAETPTSQPKRSFRL